MQQNNGFDPSVIPAVGGAVNTYVDAFQKDYNQSVDWQLDSDGRADFGAIDQSKFQMDFSPITDIGTGALQGAQFGGPAGAAIGGAIYAVPAILKTAKQIAAKKKFEREKNYAYRSAARRNGMLSEKDEIMRNYGASLRGQYNDFYGS